MLPIPGTTSLAHLEDNCRAATLTLSLDEVDQLDGAAAS
jgi:aryl-alcohol dehydrogenase-like predicted oxidoreductase